MSQINLIYTKRPSLQNAEGGNYTEEEETDTLPHPRMQIYIDCTGKLQLELLQIFDETAIAFPGLVMMRV